MSESALWTVLPAGIDADTGLLRATVFVSPRISTDGAGFVKLADCEAFSLWPEVLRGLEFTVEVDGVGKEVAKLDDRITGYDPSDWKLVFGGDVGVADPDFRDLSTKRVRTFPADEVADDLLGLYDQVALGHPGSFPPVTSGPLAEWAQDIGRIGDDRAGLYKRLDSLFGEEQSQVVEGLKGRYLRPGVVPAAQRRFFNFLQVYRFYDRFANGVSARPAPGPIDPAAVPPGPKPPELDFHAVVSALGDYPYLLRRLGLAIDVVFEPRAGFTGERRIRLLIDGDVRPWMQTEASRPWLNYTMDATFFLPRPRVPKQTIVNGQLNLPSDFFAVHQIDIDGSAMKTLNVAASALRLRNHLTSTQPSVSADESSLPALRGAGFTVVRQQRVVGTVEQFDHARLHEQDRAADTPANLFAEDVLRGYRLDVSVGGGEFASLMHRTGRYGVVTPQGTQPLDVPDDEGYAKGSSTTAVPGDDEEIYLHDAVLSWGGWSLVAKRPGQTVSPEEEIDPSPQATDPGVPLVTSFKPVPGTLTRLRYGGDYSFRVRTVDLAGNSVDPKLIEGQQASQPQPFWRWEPVPSPVVTPRRGYGEGESQLRMVIRSTLGLTTGDYVALPRVVGLSGHDTTDTAYLDRDDRWLSPPKTSQQQAEFHGVFDEAIGKGLSTAAVEEAFQVASREAGALAEVEPGETLELPYLPDVSGRGVAFTTLPYDPGGVPTRRIEWPRDDAVNQPWWDRQPFRIRIVEGAAAAPVTPSGATPAPVWDPDERLLTVLLPQAEVVDIRLSSAIAPGDLSIQGLYGRIHAAMNAAARTAAEQSRTWVFTPWQTLSLVHAVEKPLLPPVIDVPASGMQRKLGETFCALVGSVDLHARSTGRVDVEATWTEQVDDLSEDLPADGVNGQDARPGHGHVGEVNHLHRVEDDCLIGRDELPTPVGKGSLHLMRHQLGDTRHRLVTYQATATTRFREYFPPEVQQARDPGTGELLINHTGPTVQRHVPSSRRPEPPEVEYIVPTFGWTQTTAPVRGRLGGVQAVRTIRTRLGGGLRVYLKRGWYSSGDGELLGVVLTDQPWLSWPLDLRAGLDVPAALRLAADQAAERLFDRRVLVPRGAERLGASERLLRAVGLAASDLAGDLDHATHVEVAHRLAVGLASIEGGLIGQLGLLFAAGIDPAQLVTHFGADPIWGSALPSAGPFIHQFPRRTAVGTGLSLAETNKAPVTVVGHTPRFDPDRGLWYCDIDVAAGASYTPYIRLALARYQPHSIPGAHISRVVVADFAQLLPQRTATYTRGVEAVAVTVAGPAGYSEAAKALLGNPNTEYGIRLSRRVTVQVQRLAVGADPDLGWQAAGDEVELDVDVSSGLGDVRWTGRSVVPEADSGQALRLMVREYERLESDPDDDDPFDSMLTVTHGPVEFPTTRHLRERLVYADSLPLTGKLG